MGGQLSVCSDLEKILRTMIMCWTIYLRKEVLIQICWRYPYSGLIEGKVKRRGPSQAVWAALLVCCVALSGPDEATSAISTLVQG